MNTSLLLALLLLSLLGVGLGLWFLQASRRTRSVLQAACEQHGQTLQRVRTTESPVIWEGLLDDDDGWATLAGELEGARFELGASRGLGGDTKFIDLVTRLTVMIPGQQAHPRFQLPQDANRLLEQGLPDRTVKALIALAYELRLESGQLRLAVRPTGPTLHRYSYGVRLTLDHQLLLHVVVLGLDVAHRLGQAAGLHSAAEETA